MALLREHGSPEGFAFLAGLGVDLEDAGRLDVLTGTVADGGIYVDAASGESRLLGEGDAAPEGVWVAQRDLDGLVPGRREDVDAGGFGEGFGDQDEQFGGDASPPPSEDTGGTVLTSRPEPSADAGRPSAEERFLADAGTTTVAQDPSVGTDGGQS